MITFEQYYKNLEDAGMITGPYAYQYYAAKDAWKTALHLVVAGIYNGLFLRNSDLDKDDLRELVAAINKSLSKPDTM